MNRQILFIPLLATLFLSACGDEHLASESGNNLQQYVYAVPEGYTGDIVNNNDALGDLYLEQGQTVRFYAAYGLGKVIFTDETLQQYYGGCSWSIGNDNFNLSNFRYTFNKPGDFSGTLETVDLYGDTLHNDFRVHVNTPNGITLLFPYNGYNQAEPTADQQLPLRWSVQGHDPWETSSCQIFISNDPDSVWESPVGRVDCNEELSLGGSLLGQIDPDSAAILTRDSSFTLYWGIALLTQSVSGRVYLDTSEIFHFSTKIQNDSSTLKIPVAYSRFRSNAYLESNVYLISADGDTLEKHTSEERAYTVTTKVKAQSRLKILVKETLRKEYAAESIMVDIPANTVQMLDTIFLTDKITPQVAPFLDTISPADSIQYLVYDDGSGINEAKLFVLVDGDTIPSDYRSPTLLFKIKCRLNCKVEILGEDNAHNPLPQEHWYIENKSSYYTITGPYSGGIF